MAQPSHREQLVEGAIRCLKRKGYAATTARDIAAAADANLASIGYHFGSKEALLDEALIRILEQRNRHVGKLASVGGDGTLRGLLAATFDAAAKVFDGPRPLFVAFVEAMAQAQRSRELRQQMAVHYRDARRGLAAALGPYLDDADAARMAAMLLALFDGLMLQWLLDPAESSRPDELFDPLMRTLTSAAEEGDREMAS